MTCCNRMIVWFFCALITGVFLFSCSKPAEKADPKSLVVSTVEYSIRKITDNSYVLDAKGKIKNTGKRDVKNLVLTGACNSCGLEMIPYKWFISDVEKTENQKDTINYLAAGAETEFSVEDVALYFSQKNLPPEKNPEKLEIKVVSFDTVPGS